MPFKNFSEENAKPLETVAVKFKVNDDDISLNVPCHYTLLDILRYELKLTGSKEGCGMGECGACTVIMDGDIVAACLVLCTSLTGKKVLTIEGIKNDKKAKPIIDAFVKTTAVQCGFCTPGMVVSSYALLKKYKNPTNEQIMEGLSGNLCRCTGYVKIVDAIHEAAKELNK